MPTMTFLPVRLRTRSTSDPHGTLIRGILPDQKGGSSPSIKETWMTLMMLLCLPLKMWLHLSFLVSILFVLVFINNGKQIFFDTFLDIPLLRKSIRPMRLATETLVCALTILPLNAALERSWQLCWGMTVLWRNTCIPMVQLSFVMFLNVATLMWIPMTSSMLEDFLQLLSKETTNRDILLKLLWMMIGFWVPASCHGRFLLDAIKAIPQVLWEQLRTLINWQWSSLHALVGFFMWQIRSSWVLFSSMVWSVLVVILCISCMTTTMELATFERGQEQSHLVIMKHPDTAFWRQPCCWEMAMICFWLQMVLFCAMMTFLADILRSFVSSHTWDIILQIEPLDMAYHLRSRLALGATTWQSEKSTRNTCHQARYPSTWKMTRLLSGEFPIHLFQREEQQRGNSWAKKFLRGTWSCSTTFQMTEEIQKLVMICRMDYQAH